jgi:hypothetical protein
MRPSRPAAVDTRLGVATRRLRRPAALLLVAAFALGAAGPRRDRSCTAAEHRQFDFFVGNWLVADRSGRVLGTATVTKEYGGCVSIEKWRGVGDADEGLGVAGYRPESRSWHRDFADETGVVLALDGRWDGTAMVMAGTDYHDRDHTRAHRISWTPRSDGSVEQRWQTSIDGGRSWRVHLDRVFRRIAE